jgi:hypothetical protein
MREMSEESQGLEGVEPMEDVRWDLSSSDSLHASPTRVHYHHDGRSGSPPTVPRPPAVPSASASAPYLRASLPSTTRPTGSNLDPIIPSRFRIQPHPSPSSSSRTADSQSTSTLAHFLSTRSHPNSVLPARPIIMAVPLCQQQQQQQQQWRQQNAPAAATLASSASVEPPPNAKEYETVLGSAQTRALASARRDGGWVHVIGGSKILQNRAGKLHLFDYAPPPFSSSHRLTFFNLNSLPNPPSIQRRSSLPNPLPSLPPTRPSFFDEPRLLPTSRARPPPHPAPRPSPSPAQPPPLVRLLPPLSPPSHYPTLRETLRRPHHPSFDDRSRPGSLDASRPSRDWKAKAWRRDVGWEGEGAKWRWRDRRGGHGRDGRRHGMGGRG